VQHGLRHARLADEALGGQLVQHTRQRGVVVGRDHMGRELGQQFGARVLPRRQMTQRAALQ
jgi:hypothetical protein